MCQILVKYKAGYDMSINITRDTENVSTLIDDSASKVSSGNNDKQWSNPERACFSFPFSCA